MHTKKTQQPTSVKRSHQVTWQDREHAIIGVMLVLVTLSIAFSSYVVWAGTQGPVPKLMLLPQMAFAAAIIVWKFTRK